MEVYIGRLHFSNYTYSDNVVVAKFGHEGVTYQQYLDNDILITFTLWLCNPFCQVAILVQYIAGHLSSNKC